MGLELVDPLVVDLEQHDGVGVAVLVVGALQLRHVHVVMHSVVLKNRSGLLMYTANYDGLLHALERHAKQENAGYLQIARQIHKYLAQSCYLASPLLLSLGKGRRYSQSSCLLQILYGIAYVSKLWWLDSPAQYLLRFIAIPKFDLEYKFL